MKAELGPAINAQDSVLTVEGSNFKNNAQSFQYITRDYQPNEMYKFKEAQGVANETFSSIMFQCADDKTTKGNGLYCDAKDEEACSAGNGCCIQLKNLEFEGASGFSVNPPVDPIIPPYPSKVTYTIKPEEKYG